MQFSVALIAFSCLQRGALAQSSDALLDKLVEKGILTVKEANDLKHETDQDFKKAYSVRSGMPDWVQSMKLNGDFRGRFDGLFQNNDNNPAVLDRNRLRYRVRFGATAVMNDHFEVGLRLASGDPFNAANGATPLGGSIFSANTTLNNDGSRKFVWIDAAYAKWTPYNWLQAQIGKMDSTFWLTDAVLDPDYQPEGAQEKLTYEINDVHKLGLTSGQWVISEQFLTGTPAAPGSPVAYNSDVYVFVNQADWTAKWTPKITTRAAVGMINFKNQKRLVLTSPAAAPVFNVLDTLQNGTPLSGVGSENFNPIIARGEATYSLASFPMFTGEFPITIGGEYVKNPGANADPFPGKAYDGSNNQAYNLGVTFGSAKVRGNWQISYNYKYIEAAATWKGMNDDDFGWDGRGGTDVRGHFIKAWYKPADALTVVLSYFITEQINNTALVRPEQQRIFLDLIWAF